MTTNQHLTQLESTGLLRLAQNQPELEYLFRHALVQDAAYASLLIADRKALHRQVGETIERLYPNRLDEIAPVLAQHFILADDYQHALNYFILAGDLSARIYANAEAVSHYTRALEIVRELQINHKDFIHVYTSLGRVLELNSQFDEALAHYQDMEKLAHQHNEPSLELAALTAQITLYATPTPLHNPGQGLALGQNALRLARSLGNGAGEAKVLWNLSLAANWAGQIDEAISYGQEAVTLAKAHNLPELQAFALNDLCLVFLNARFEQAKAALQEVKQLWRELGNLPMLTDSLCLSIAVHLVSGEYEQAIAASNEAFQISQASNNLWGQSFSCMLIGRVYWDQGEVDRAIALAEECLHLSELSGFVVPKVMTHADLAMIYGSLGAIEQGLKMAHLAVTSAEKEFPAFKMWALGELAQLYILRGNLTDAAKTVEQGKKDPYRDIYATWYIPVANAEAQLALSQGNYEQALLITDAWLATFRQMGMQMPIPLMLFIQAQALLMLGQDKAAYQRLLEARTEAEAIGSRRMLWQILAVLANIEPEPTEAESLRQQARQIIDYITHHTPVELQALFLHQPAVQAVFST